MAEKKVSTAANVLAGAVDWVDARFPLTSNIKNHLTE